MATYYGANCVYIVFISQSLHDVINDSTGITWDVRIYIIFSTIAVLLIAQVSILYIYIHIYDLKIGWMHFEFKLKKKEKEKIVHFP